MDFYNYCQIIHEIIVNFGTTKNIKTILLNYIRLISYNNFTLFDMVEIGKFSKYGCANILGPALLPLGIYETGFSTNAKDQRLN